MGDEVSGPSNPPYPRVDEDELDIIRDLWIKDSTIRISYGRMCHVLRHDHGIDLSTRQLGYRLKKLGLSRPRNGKDPAEEIREIVTGPNQIWYIKGHDKLRDFGLYINWCMDSFSGHVIWLEIGPSCKVDRVNGHYFLTAVEKMRGTPRNIVCNEPEEHIFVGATQNFLRQDDEATSFSKTKRDKRVAAFCATLRRSWIIPLVVHLDNLDMEGFFTYSHLDRCLVRFCYTNYLKKELQLRLEYWNNHCPKHDSSPTARQPQGTPISLYTRPQLHGYADQICRYPAIKLEEARCNTSPPSLTGDAELGRVFREVVAQERVPYPCQSYSDCWNTYCIIRERVLQG